MTKMASYPVVKLSKSDLILGTDKSDTSQDPLGKTVNFLAGDFVTTEVSENLPAGTSYTLSSSDVNGIVTMQSSSANTVTIPSHASDPIPIGSTILIHQEGSGTTTIRAASGVTLRGVSAGACQLLARYGSATLFKRGTNQWVVLGAVGAVS